MQNLTPYFDFPPPHCLFTMILFLGGGLRRRFIGVYWWDR